MLCLFGWCGRYGYLIWLGVSPDVQRLGVGRRLVRTLIPCQAIRWRHSFAHNAW